MEQAFYAAIGAAIGLIAGFFLYRRYLATRPCRFFRFIYDNVFVHVAPYVFLFEKF